MEQVQHPSDELLSAFIQREGLSADRVEQLLDHLDSCPSCAGRLEALEPTLTHFRQWRGLVLHHLPQPARPWVDLEQELRRRENPPARAALNGRPAGRQAMLWLAAAAAVLLIASLFFRPGGHTATPNAETLLARAEASVSPYSITSRLRVRTPSGSFLRPAVLLVGVGITLPSYDEAVRARFKAARYDWDDPLNVATYSRWRNTLRRKTDRVEVAGAQHDSRQYTIRTSTSDSELQEAALTLDAARLAPVNCKFVFKDQEWVEISALPDSPNEGAAAPVTPILPSPSPTAAPPQPSLAQRELSVWLAIDELSGDAGVPIAVAVDPEDQILVTPYGLPPEHEQQLRTSLAGISGVTVRSPSLGSGTAAVKISEQTGDRAIDLSESAAATAHRLAEFEARFGPSGEAQLTQAERDALWQMRKRHATRLNRSLDALAALLPDADGAPSGAEEQSMGGAPPVDSLV
jgi:hypothetical protein